MASENETRIIAVLRGVSYMLLLSGILTVSPFALFSLLKVAAPGHAAMLFIAAGGIALCLPIVFVPASALWVGRMSGNHDDKFYVLSRGCIRYLPALSLGLVELFISAKTGNAYVSLGFGAVLIVYATFLLKLDADRARI